MSTLHETLATRGWINLANPQDLPLGDAEPFEAGAREIEASLLRQDITMEGKPMAVNPRPFVLSDRFDRALSEQLRAFWVILEQLPRIFRDSPRLRRYYDLGDKHLVPLLVEPEATPWINYCRFDFALSEECTPRILEINSAQPAGISLDRHVYEAHLRTSVPALLAERLGLELEPFPFLRSPVFAETFVEAWQRRRGTTALPNVAILNSRYHTLSFELDLLRADFEALGCRAVRAFVQDVVYEGGRLHAGDLPIDLCYVKFWGLDDAEHASAFSKQTREVVDFMLAVRDGAVMVLNSLHANYLVENKSTLDCLRHPDVRARLTPEEADLVERLVPGTRLVVHLTEDELRRVVDHRDAYVLKQSLNTRGRGLHLGWETPPETWQALVREARAKPHPQWVVQDRVPLDEHAVGSRTMYTSLAYYFLNGRPVGLLVRQSSEAVTNVGRSGAKQISLLARA